MIFIIFMAIISFIVYLGMLGAAKKKGSKANFFNYPVAALKDPGSFAPLIVGIFVLFFFMIVAGKSAAFIDSGEVANPVLFGKVLDRTLKEGLNFKSPLVSLKKLSIRLQEYTMVSAIGEGSRDGDDSLTIKTSEDINLGVDMTVFWKIDPTKAPNIYRDLTKDFNDLEDRILRPIVRSIIRDVSVGYTMQELFSESRSNYISELTSKMSAVALEKYIIIDSILIRKIDPPKEVNDAIAQKMKIQQEAEAMKFEKEKAIIANEIREIDARGLAKAQNIINSTLTPLYVQHEALATYKELAGSDNTTFVIMPTSPNGAGIPIILGAPK